MAIYFLAALIGIIVANLFLEGMTVDTRSYFSVAIIFAIIQAILSPLISNMAEKNAPAFTGGIGLLSTFVALFITNIALSGITVSGFSTWILASLIIWLVTAIAVFILPFLLVKKVVNERRN